jgi:hypothetical protein
MPLKQLTEVEIGMRSIKEAGKAAGYSTAEIEAGFMHSDRKSFRADPPGKTDRAGRFTPTEQTRSVRTVRSPSIAYPNSEKNAARTAAHCSEVCNAERVLAVKRVARARDMIDQGIGIALAHIKPIKA